MSIMHIANAFGFFSLGRAAIRNRKRFAQRVMAAPEGAWGFHKGEREVKISEVVLLVAGTGLLVAALVNLWLFARGAMS
jgi:hypothetical protein